MAEFKPRQDNELARDQVKGGKPDAPQVSKETKPHGDKLRDAFENDKKPMGKPH